MPSDLYGSKSQDLEDVKSRVERVLESTLEERDSTYFGGRYYKAVLMNGEEIVVRRNFDPLDQEAAETEFKEYPIIVYVNNSMRAEQVRTVFEKVGLELKLLRHK
jgi:uncharacterized protein YacL (UPF0231 family)